MYGECSNFENISIYSLGFLGAYLVTFYVNDTQLSFETEAYPLPETCVFSVCFSPVSPYILL